MRHRTVYAVDDVMDGVQSKDEGLVAEIVGRLP
jgi:hypothetical protein